MKQGDTFTNSFVISEQIYNKFVELFGDRNPLHTDASFAVSQGFRDKVMHGNILNGFLSFFIGPTSSKDGIFRPSASVATQVSA